MELVHGERPIPGAARTLRSLILPAAAIPMACLAFAVVLMIAGVVTRESGSMGSLVYPSFSTGFLLHLWTRPRRPRIALVQDRMEAGAIRDDALRRGTVPRQPGCAESAGIRSCEDLELACLLGATLVTAVALALVWPLGNLWVVLPVLVTVCIVYAVRAPRAWHYLQLLHGR